ncbi:MarR family winged helix-turn-helix transcriptional regulator [Ferrimonas sp.]|uniref:MarR family winged helix-turn-helix transcriptional regulator n=1 Tax=Ferrimonas sp. TaxID=2080861 RepID=UPI003A9124E5
MNTPVNQLKAAMFEESSNVSRALYKLVDAGFVHKGRNDEDQRVVHIQITATGSKAHREADQALMGASFGLNSAEEELLFSLLAKVVTSPQD